MHAASLRTHLNARYASVAAGLPIIPHGQHPSLNSAVTDQSFAHFCRPKDDNNSIRRLYPSKQVPKLLNMVFAKLMNRSKCNENADDSDLAIVEKVPASATKGENVADLSSTDGSSFDDDDVSSDASNPLSIDQDSLEESSIGESETRTDENKKEGGKGTNNNILGSGNWNKAMLGRLFQNASQAAKVTTSQVANQASRLQVTRIAEKAGKTAKVQSHITTLRAGLTVWDHEMKIAKHQFGIDCYDTMERNRSMGDPSGGETEPEIVEVFVKIVQKMKPLYSLRKNKLQQLTQMKCTAGSGSDSSSRTDSLGGLLRNDRRPSYNIYDDQRSNIYDTCKIDNTVEEEKAKKGNSSNPFKAGQNLIMQRWNQAQESYIGYSQQSSIKNDLKDIDKEIRLHKQQFGVDMYHAMFNRMNMVDENGSETAAWEPRDDRIKELFHKARDRIAIPHQRREVANREINDLTENGCILVSHSEVMDYVHDQPHMYVPLSHGTGLPEHACQRIAVYVAIELIRTSTGGQWKRRQQRGGIIGDDEDELILTKRKFNNFTKIYVDGRKGSQEFYLRCLFEICDGNADGYLNKDQVNLFLGDPIFRDNSASSAPTNRFKDAAWDHLLSESREKEPPIDSLSGCDSDNTTLLYSFEQLYQVIRKLTVSRHDRNATGDKLLRQGVTR